MAVRLICSVCKKCPVAMSPCSEACRVERNAKHLTRLESAESVTPQEVRAYLRMAGWRLMGGYWWLNADAPAADKHGPCIGDVVVETSTRTALMILRAVLDVAQASAAQGAISGSCSGPVLTDIKVLTFKVPAAVLNALSQMGQDKPPRAPDPPNSFPGGPECPVYGCSGTIDPAGEWYCGWVCAACWYRLPSLTRDSITACFAEVAKGHTSKRGDLLLEQAMQRLCAEGRGRAEKLNDDEEDDAFTLAYQAMSVGVPGMRFVGVGCFEWADVLEKSLDVSDGKGGGFGANRRVCEALANYYDRAQAARGDARRAIRLGYGGL